MEVDSDLMLQLLAEGSQLQAKILEERVNGELKVWYISAHNRFFNSFKKKLKQMSEAGLFNQFIREAKEVYIRNTVEQQEEPFKVLTLEELEAGFVVCIVPLVLAMAILCLEWIVPLKDLVAFLCIFKAFFKYTHPH